MADLAHERVHRTLPPALPPGRAGFRGVMEPLRAWKLRWAGGRLFRQRGPIVLLYHRISNEPHDPFRLNVSPANFAEHLDVLSRMAVPTPLEALVKGGQQGRADGRAVSITFDDGYADNLYAAKPLLERAGIRATVFVATGGDGREFWWDALVRIVYTTATFPERLELTIGGTPIRWSKPRRRGRFWRFTGGPDRMEVDASVTVRRSLLRALYRPLRTQPREVQMEVLEQIAAWSGEPLASSSGHRAATHEELATLIADSVISLGAHSVSHPVLSMLDPETCAREIRDSRRTVEEITGTPVTSFAYPFGQPGDYSPGVLAMVRDAGFEFACAATAGVLAARLDPYEIPRVWVEDCDGEEFARQVSRWLDPPGVRSQ